VGSGPFRFVAEDWDMSTRATFVKFDKYVPRPGKPEFWAGGKATYIDRVEWHIMPDMTTAAEALIKNEIDWIERPLFDLLGQLRKAPGVKIEVVDPLGSWAEIYFNNALPPFDNPRLRRALFPAIVQSDFMQALFGDQTELFHTGVGPFLPSSPYASAVGMEALTGPRSLDAARKLIKESGYNGELIVQMIPTDQVAGNAYGMVTNQLLRDLGLNVRLDAMDWGTLLTRWNAKENSAQGAWNVFAVSWSGLWVTNPGSHVTLHGNKPNPKMEELTAQWFDAPDLAAQKKVCEQIQLLAFEEPPFIPIGQYFPPHAHRDSITDIVHAPFAQFWNVRKG
jgi:peptide/nickel transport system substrate-binding protein